MVYIYMIYRGYTNYYITSTWIRCIVWQNPSIAHFSHSNYIYIWDWIPGSSVKRRLLRVPSWWSIFISVICSENLAWLALISRHSGSNWPFNLGHRSNIEGRYLGSGTSISICSDFEVWNLYNWNSNWCIYAYIWGFDCWAWLPLMLQRVCTIFSTVTIFLWRVDM